VTKTKRLVAALLAVLAVVGLAACDPGPSKPSASARSQAVTEKYQARLETAVPYPLEAMKDSIERRNLRERLLRFNQANKIGYVYLLSSTGSVVAFYTIKGKVSSTQSQMTAADSANFSCRTSHGCTPLVREAPGDDGSYGPNEDGVFFFTTEDVMVQWSGPFLYADAPLKVASAPLMILEAGSKPSSTSETKP
jgi:hypothetical protein